MIILLKNFIFSILLNPFSLTPTYAKYSKIDYFICLLLYYLSLVLICTIAGFLVKAKNSVKNIIKNIDSKGGMFTKSAKYFKIERLPFDKVLPTNLAANFAKFDVFLAL